MGCCLPSLGLEPVEVDEPLKSVMQGCSVRRQTYGYLPSCRASLPLDRYQIILILLGDRGTCVCEQRLLPASGTAVTRTRDLLSRESSTLTTAPPGHAGQVCGGEMSYSREGRERVGPGRTFHSCASDKRPARRSGFVD